MSFGTLYTHNVRHMISEQAACIASGLTYKLTDKPAILRHHRSREVPSH